MKKKKPAKAVPTSLERKKSASAGANADRAKSAGKKNSFARQSTVSETPTKAELRHVSWSSVAIEELNPLLGRQFVVGQNVMLARVLLQKGCVVPEHSHHNEQITYILAGSLKFGIDGREIIVNAGEVLTIPPNMPHWAEAMADTVDLDIFNPPRADWINKTDAYLR